MPTLRVNGYDMAFVERGTGAPLLLVHGTLCDYRQWTGQMASFGGHYRTIALSLRHCWPEHWDGEGDDFTVQQHVADVASFISALEAGPVHLLGHSRGGHLAFRVAQNFPASHSHADPCRAWRRAGSRPRGGPAAGRAADRARSALRQGGREHPEGRDRRGSSACDRRDRRPGNLGPDAGIAKANASRQRPDIARPDQGATRPVRARRRRGDPRADAAAWPANARRPRSTASSMDWRPRSGMCGARSFPKRPIRPTSTIPGRSRARFWRFSMGGDERASAARQ